MYVIVLIRAWLLRVEGTRVLKVEYFSYGNMPYLIT